MRCAFTSRQASGRGPSVGPSLAIRTRSALSSPIRDASDARRRACARPPLEYMPAYQPPRRKPGRSRFASASDKLDPQEVWTSGHPLGKER